MSSMNKRIIGILISFVFFFMLAKSIWAVGGVVGSVQSIADTTITVLQNGTSVLVPITSATQFFGLANTLIAKNDIGQGDMLVAPSASGSATKIYVYKPNQKGEQIAIYGTLTGVNNQTLAVLQDGTRDTYYTVTLAPTTIVKNTQHQVVSLVKDDTSKKVLVVGKIDQAHIVTGSVIIVQTE